MLHRALLPLITLILYCTECNANIQQAIQRADDLKLDRHITWKRLLVTDVNRTDDQLKSDVLSPEFFLSKTNTAQATVSRKAELEYTIRAFFESPSNDIDNHAQCRFRGRFAWLSSQLDLKSLGLPPIECKAYNKWAKVDNFDSVSLVFASGYLNNPASYYGHVLLKINEKNKSANLEASTLNFGAIIPKNQNALIYIAKGLLGGYKSGFTKGIFYEQSHNYGENELRNLWDYELQLGQVERDILLGHAWELIGRKYTYYFLNRNCAHRMGELLETAGLRNIVPRSRFWSIPQSLIQNLSRPAENEDNYIRNINFIPSRQSRFYQRYRALSPSQKEMLKNLARGEIDLHSTSFLELNIDAKHSIIDTLLDYYKLLELEGSETKTLYRKTLLARYRLPPGGAFKARALKNEPHLGRPPSYLSLSLAGLSGRDDNQFAGELRIRPAYYDTLDRGAGHIHNTRLSMADLTLQVNDKEINIENFDIVRIESAHQGLTSLPGDKSGYWDLSLGLRKFEHNCQDCLLPRFQTSRGKIIADESFDKILGVYISLGAQENYRDFGSLFSSLAVFSNLKLSGKSALRLSSHYDIQLKPPYDSLNSYQLIYRYEAHRTMDMRIELSKKGEHKLALSVGHYW